MNIYIRGTINIMMIGHNDAVYSVYFIGDYLISGSSDGLVKIWHWEEGYCINTLAVHNGYVHRVLANTKYAIISSGCSTTKIIIWDLESDTFNSFYNHKGRVKALAICDDNFATGGSDSMIKIWDYQGNHIDSLVAHTGTIIELIFHSGNLISSAEDKYIYIWDWNNHQILSKCYGFVAARIKNIDNCFIACESKGNNLKQYT